MINSIIKLFIIYFWIEFVDCFIVKNNNYVTSKRITVPYNTLCHELLVNINDTIFDYNFNNLTLYLDLNLIKLSTYDPKLDYGIYFDIGMHSEAINYNIDPFSRSRKGSQFLSLKLELKYLNENYNVFKEFLIYEHNRLLIYDNYRFFTKILGEYLNHKDLKLKITILTYATNFSWRFKKKNQYIEFGNVILLPTDEIHKAKQFSNLKYGDFKNNIIADNNYTLAIESFLKNTKYLNTCINADTLLILEKEKRNFNENTQEYVTVIFFITLIGFVLLETFIICFIIIKNLKMLKI